MPKKSARLHVRAIAAICAFAVANASHASLQGNLDGMFVATTDPRAFETPNYKGLSFGSAAVRWPIRNHNVIAFDPPRLNAGCSGIDMYLGSFSFINADQFKNMLRGIAQGIVGFAFKAAIRSISPTIASVMDKLEDAMRAINNMGRNTCAIAKGVVDSAQASWQSGQLQTKGYLKTAANDVTGWFEGIEKAFRNTDTNPTTEQKINEANDLVGNALVRAFYESDAAGAIDAFLPYGEASTNEAKKKAIELAINMFGTMSLPSGAASTPAGGDASATYENTAQKIEGKIGYDHIYNGKSAHGDEDYFICPVNIDGLMSCTPPSIRKYDFIGTYPYVRKMLWGCNPENALNDDTCLNTPTVDSIVYKLNRGEAATLTTKQKQFLSSFNGLNITRLVFEGQDDLPTVSILLQKGSQLLAQEMATIIMKTMVNTTKNAFSNAKQTAPRHVRMRIEAVQAEAMMKSNLLDTRTAYLSEVMEFTTAIRQNLKAEYRYPGSTVN